MLNQEASQTSAGSNLLARLWRHFSRRRQLQFVGLLGLVLVSALAEVVSLGAVLPFIGILTAPERALALPLVAELIRMMGVTSPEQLALLLTVTFAILALGASAIRMLVLWVSNRLAFASGADISINVYRRTLYQPYRVHVARNSSEVISGITQKVSNVVEMLHQVLTLISSLVLMVAILLALFLIDPLVALVATLGFGASYGAIAWVFRRRLHRNSEQIAREQTHVVKALQEGLGGIRDVLLDGTQPVYCEIYRKADLPLRRAQAHNLFIAGSPRFVMEGVGMVLIALLAYGLSLREGGIATALPVIGALAVGAQRLIPIMQQGYTAWATVAGKRAALESTVELLDQDVQPEALRRHTVPLPFQNEVAFRGVRFQYDESASWALEIDNLAIRKGARIGLVGSTGSGKSTMVDLLMGLLTPDRGEILVDGEPLIGARVGAWQKAIAHVPQTIFLADASIKENIAFGIPLSRIDTEKVQLAARQAQIDQFIESLPERYTTRVGERGVRLSGGQRQRIGIARALYKQASVLVFDEATSALDNATEKSVMEALENLNRELTILLIAHRLSTLRACDTIVQLEGGRVVAKGSFDDLLQNSPTFRQMAHLPGEPIAAYQIG